jgi:hypothetical protein
MHPRPWSLLVVIVVLVLPSNSSSSLGHESLVTDDMRRQWVCTMPHDYARIEKPSPRPFVHVLLRAGGTPHDERVAGVHLFATSSDFAAASVEAVVMMWQEPLLFTRRGPTARNPARPDEALFYTILAPATAMTDADTLALARQWALDPTRVPDDLYLSVLVTRPQQRSDPSTQFEQLMTTITRSPFNLLMVNCTRQDTLLRRLLALHDSMATVTVA